LSRRASRRCDRPADKLGPDASKIAMPNIPSSTGPRLAAVALVYYLLARFGMALFALQPSNITLLWLPAGVGLVACLHWGWRAVPLLVLASFAANYPGMSGAGVAHAGLHTAVAGLADGLGALLASAMARRFLPEGLKRAQDLLPLCVWVCLLPTSLTAAVLALNLLWGGYIAWRDMGDMLLMLVLADSLGLVLVYQVYEAWLERRTAAAGTVERRRLWAATACLLLLLALGAGPLKGLLFFVPAVLVALSFHASLPAVALLSSLVLVAVIAGTAQGLGPFVAELPEDSRLELMSFAFAGALTVLGVALQHRQLRQSQRSGEQWRAAAECDELTGLMNRRAFLPRLQLEQQRAQRSGRGFTLAMLDRDHFKQINDSHGHPFGDQVLVGFTALMLENCRAIDAVARLGGEEFAILLPESAEADALVALERVRSKLQAKAFVSADGQPVRLTVSIGVAVWHAGQASETELLRRADRALYAAKAAGRNRIVVDAQA